MFKSFCYLSICISYFAVFAENTSAEVTLGNQYEQSCHTLSDIYEHVPTLHDLARECSSIVEIGLRDMVSSWGLLYGLSKNSSLIRSYVGIDINLPPLNTLSLAKSLSISNGISFQFLQKNDLDLDIPVCDLLFIDSLHTYCHLSYELDRFSCHVTKYIVMHDTSEPWGNADETGYRGDYSEYSLRFDRSKKGLWPAVEDFLKMHPEWTLHKRYMNNHGLTILKRK